MKNKDKLRLLQREKEEAVEDEDYALAAKLKERIELLRRSPAALAENGHDPKHAEKGSVSSEGGAPAPRTDPPRKNRRRKSSPVRVLPETGPPAHMLSCVVEMTRANNAPASSSSPWKKIVNRTTEKVFWINTDTGDVSHEDPGLSLDVVQAISHMKHHRKTPVAPTCREYITPCFLVGCCCPCFVVTHCVRPDLTEKHMKYFEKCEHCIVKECGSFMSACYICCTDIICAPCRSCC